MRIKLTIEYDGTEYAGWQIQPNEITVQQVIETAIFKITGEQVTLTASGRTDAGVHAKGQVAHFDTNANISPDRFKNAINSKLPNDIRILKSEEVDGEFNARYSAKKKTYEYRFYIGEKSPLKERYALNAEYLDIKSMKKCAKKIVGEHDFKCFCSSGSSVKTTVRTVYSIKINRDGDFISVFVTGNGFLYNMVRYIAGTLKAVSDKKISLKEVEEMLFSGVRLNAVTPLSAKGLTLKKVEYDKKQIKNDKK